jgi:hypothetical protein
MVVPNSSPRALLLTVSCLITLLTGCGQTGPVQVQPKFLLDGKPLPEVSVSFIRNDGQPGRSAYGATDSEGVATLTTKNPDDGVMPGPYSVVVIRVTPDFGAIAVDETNTSDPRAFAKMSSGGGSVSRPRGKRILSTLPDIYADPGATPLKCVVEPGVTELNFNLSSKP